MNSQTEHVTAPHTRSQSETVLHVLREHAPSWVALPVLVQHGGGYAIHSRVAELRTRGHCIENMIQREESGRKRSYYRIMA